MDMNRRRFLALVATSSATMSGCTSLSPDVRPSAEKSGSGTIPIRWKANLGKRLPVPAVIDETVYAVSSTSGVSAFATADGNRQWTRPAPRSAWFGPAAFDDLVYAVDYETLVALDAATGEEHWRFTWPEEAAMEALPVVSQEAIFAGISSLPTSHTESKFPEDLWVFDRLDGSLKWKRDLSDGRLSGTQGPVTGPPVLHDGALYVQTQDGSVMALTPTDGRERWRAALNGRGGVGGPVLIPDRQTLVVNLETRSGEGDGTRELVGLSMVDGQERWRTKKIQTAPVTDGATVYGGEIAAIGGHSTVYALSAANGRKQWEFTRPGRLKTWTSLSATGGTLFASFTQRTDQGDVKDDDSTLYAVSPDGTERWRFKRSCEGFSQAVVSNGAVYVGGRYGDGTLYALALNA